MKTVFTEKDPVPAGHYVQAYIHENIAYLSGQLPIDPLTGEKVLGSIELQTERVLRNICEVVRAAGSDTHKIIKTTVYVTDIKLWDRVNKVYADFFQDHKPTRSVVPVKELHFGFQIEIDAIAVID